MLLCREMNGWMLTNRSGPINIFNVSQTILSLNDFRGTCMHFDLECIQNIVASFVFVIFSHLHNDPVVTLENFGDLLF